MLTGKQRAALRKEAVSLSPVFQVGKGGVDEALVTATSLCLAARELVKLRVLETSPATAREAANLLAEATGAEVVLVIGGVFVLFLGKGKDSLYAGALKGQAGATGQEESRSATKKNLTKKALPKPNSRKRALQKPLGGTGKHTQAVGGSAVAANHARVPSGAIKPGSYGRAASATGTPASRGGGRPARHTASHKPSSTMGSGIGRNSRSGSRPRRAK